MADASKDLRDCLASAQLGLAAVRLMRANSVGAPPFVRAAARQRINAELGRVTTALEALANEQPCMIPGCPCNGGSA